ncbi:MAG: cupin domain-containing protein [Thermoanaerobaculia bacterium]|nr:cupin domain-containing protein [Thermoanaerobaculia bacterium]
MRRRDALLAAGLLVLAAAAVAASPKGTTVTAKGALVWTDAAIPGVASAAVEGDMAKGSSHFYLRYAAGLVTPLHHHSPDHYVTTLAGALTLVVDGKEHRLAPGSYFALLGKTAHTARCEGNEDCLMFVDARGPWDVVPEAAKP